MCSCAILNMIKDLPTPPPPLSSNMWFQFIFLWHIFNCLNLTHTIFQQDICWALQSFVKIETLFFNAVVVYNRHKNSIMKYLKFYSILSCLSHSIYEFYHVKIFFISLDFIHFQLHLLLCFLPFFRSFEELLLKKWQSENL